MSPQSRKRDECRARARELLAASAERIDSEYCKVVIRDLLAEIDTLETDLATQGAAPPRTNPQRKIAHPLLPKHYPQLRTVFNAIPDLIWLKNPEGVYLSCNLAFEQFVGVCELDVIGHTDFDFFDHELATFFRSNDAIALTTDRPSINTEWLTWASNGYHGLFETIKTSMYTADGYLVGVLGIARDISAMHQAQLALREERQHFLDLFENSPVATWLEDLTPIGAWMETLRRSGVRDLRTYLYRRPGTAQAILSRLHVLNMNQAAVTLNGARDKEHLRASLGQLFAYASEVSLIDELVTIWEGGARFEFEMETVGLDQQRRSLINRMDIPHLNGKLDLTRVIFTSIDVTERVRATAALQDSETRFKLAMEVSHEGMWEWNGESNQAVYSPAFFSVLGREPHECYNRPTWPFWLAWVHPADRKLALTTVRHCLKGALDSFDIELRMRHQDGGWRWIIGRGRVLARGPNGWATHMIGTNIEITASKAAEQSLRARTVEIESLFSISTSLSAARSAEEIMALVLAELHGALDTDASTLSLIDADSGQFYIASADGILADLVGWTYGHDSLSGQVCCAGQPLIITNLAIQQTPLRDTFSQRLGPAILVPLIASAQILGVLSVARLNGAPLFTPADLRLVTAVGEIAGIALQRAQLSDQAVERLARLQSLRHIDRVITSSLDLQLTFGVVLAEVLAQLNAD
ncbi:MAG: PAS domain-containing protein, partial [Oscillochloris sp.]|nr:PAS domain-containing protein [Oscillochloris sp.]